MSKKLLLLPLVLLAPVFTAEPRTAGAATAVSSNTVLEVTIKTSSTSTGAQVRKPALAEVDGVSLLNGASRIDTYPAPPNMTASVSPGGCAVLQDARLACWGSNSVGQLGTGNNTSSSTPVVSAGISEVSDVAASGASTCAVSRTDLYCTGLGPWPGNLSTSTSWVKINSEPVTRVVMGTVIARDERPPVCVVTSYGGFKCFSSTSTGAGTWTFAWVDSGLSGVTDAAMAVHYYPGAGNACVLAGVNISCGTVGSGGMYSSQSRITSRVPFRRVYLVNWKYPAVCGWDGSILSCGAFTYPSSSPYKAPSEVRVVGVTPEPLSLVYDDSSNVERVYLLHSNGVLALKTEFLESANFQYGSVDSNFETVGNFRSTASGVSLRNSRILGPSDSVGLLSAVVETSPRSMIGSTSVQVTAGGTPVKNAMVSWYTTDDDTLLGSSSSGGVTTDSTGTARLSQLASGSVTFKIAGGSVGTSAYLQIAYVTVDVVQSSPVVLAVPAPPATLSRSFLVTLPDGTPVPNASVILNNSFLTFSFVSNGADRSAWSAEMPDPAKYLKPPTCPFCLVNPPTYLADGTGRATMTVFDTNLRTGDYDATVSYDDGEFSQSKRVTTLKDASTVAFDFMQKVVKVSAGTEVAVPASGEVTLSALVKTAGGTAQSATTVTAETVCSTLVSGGLWQEGQKLGVVTCATVLGSKATASGIHASGASCGTTGLTGADGTAQLVLCPTKSGYVRLRVVDSAPSLMVCLVVGSVKCTIGSTSGGEASSASGVVPVSVKRGKSVKRSTLYISSGLTSVTGSISLKIPKSYAKVCKVQGTAVRTLKTGTCKVAVTVTTKAKKKTSRTVTIRVT